MSKKCCGVYFVNFALTSEDSISRKLCWTMHHYGVAPIALVFGAQHWIVVRGYGATDAPNSSEDTSYTINHFDINNPWPPVPSFSQPSLAPPPPHSTTDGCGTGGNRGIANEYISYADWQSTYMTGVSFGYWNGKFVAVCDPEPPPTYVGRPRLLLKRLRGFDLVTPEAAKELAIAGLQESGLYNRGGGWQNSLENTQPGDPLLVQRLDRSDSFYYLVPMERNGEPTGASVRIDARFGDHLGSIMLPTHGHGGELSQASRLPVNLSNEVAIDRIADQRIELGNQLGRLRIRKEIVVPYSTLVWKPCLESLSPYYPFRMYIIGSQRLYVRSDGEMFTQLHENLRGI